MIGTAVSVNGIMTVPGRYNTSNTSSLSVGSTGSLTVTGAATDGVVFSNGTITVDGAVVVNTPGSFRIDVSTVMTVNPTGSLTGTGTFTESNGHLTINENDTFAGTLQMNDHEDR